MANKIDLLLLDFSKGFDNVSHHRLLIIMVPRDHYFIGLQIICLPARLFWMELLAVLHVLCWKYLRAVCWDPIPLFLFYINDLTCKLMLLSTDKLTLRKMY